MRRALKWTGISLAIVLAIAVGVGCYFMGGPRDLYGFLRYALPQWHRGNLHVGEAPPDIRLISLDGQSNFYLHNRLGARPLVLVFGSYT